MAKQLPFFPFYSSTWLGDPNVSALSYELQGVFVRLMCAMWEFRDHSCSLPDDDEYLAEFLKVTPVVWSRWRKVLIDGPGAVMDAVDGRIVSQRLLAERAKAEKRSRAGSGNITHRWEANKDTDVIPTGYETDSEDVPNENQTDTDGIHLNSFKREERETPLPPLNLTDVERQILAVFKGITNYPLDYETDLSHVRALAIDFASVDLLVEAKKWATYKTGRGKELARRSNARLQFRNWCENAQRFATERAGRDGRRQPPAPGLMPYHREVT